MIDKDTQVEGDQDFSEGVLKSFRCNRIRKISVVVIPTAFSFNIKPGLKPLVVHPLPSRCGSRKSLQPKLRRNSSELHIRPVTLKPATIVNLSFAHNPYAIRRKIR